MSAYLVVVLSVLASATATLTLNLLARLDWRQAAAGCDQPPTTPRPARTSCWSLAGVPAAA